VRLRVDRIKYWLGEGAQPSERVAYLLWRAGLMPEPPIRFQTQKSVSKQKAGGAEGGGGGGGAAGGGLRGGGFGSSQRAAGFFGRLGGVAAAAPPLFFPLSPGGRLA
jgi:hypothetical protein